MLKIADNSKYFAITVLIGGKSTRFGSDKGLYNFLGRPLISYPLETLSQNNWDIFLIANSSQQVQNYINKINIEKIMGFIIDDKEFNTNKDLRTPIIGLYSALKELDRLNYEKVLVLACDNPLIQYNVVKFLIEQSVGYDCCIPRWDNGYLEPLVAIYPIKKTIKKARENFSVGNLKLSDLLDHSWNINFLSIENVIKPIDPNLLTFLNVNTSEDLNHLTRLYEKKKKKIKKIERKD
ncbi:MAG: molybdenum cofactor guanylyltransferase [Promethearchaeota archaeon]|jgi:molybdopterin-guanine dinucleotide biosynthesis protein A